MQQCDDHHPDNEDDHQDPGNDDHHPSYGEITATMSLHTMQHPHHASLHQEGAHHAFLHHGGHALLHHCNMLQLNHIKLQGKVVTHFEEVVWWRTFMVECVTVFSTLHNTKSVKTVTHFTLKVLHIYIAIVLYLTGKPYVIGWRPLYLMVSALGGGVGVLALKFAINKRCRLILY